MNTFHSKNARQGSTILAAVMLVAAVGIVSATLQYVNPPAKEAQTANAKLAADTPTATFIGGPTGGQSAGTYSVTPASQTATTPTAPAATTPPSSSKVSQDPRCSNPTVQSGGLNDKGDLLCACSKPTSSDGQVGGQCLAGCSYDGKLDKEGKLSLSIKDSNAYSTSKSSPGGDCTVCIDGTCGKAPADKPSEGGAKEPASSGGAKPGGSAQDAAKTAADMLKDVVAGKEGDANNKANAYAAAGGNLNALADELKKQVEAAPPDLNATRVPGYANEMIKQLQTLGSMAGGAGSGGGGGAPSGAGSGLSASPVDTSAFTGKNLSAGMDALNRLCATDPSKCAANQPSVNPLSGACAASPTAPGCPGYNPNQNVFCTANPTAQGCPGYNPNQNTFNTGPGGLFGDGAGSGIMSFLSGMARGFMGGMGGYGGYGGYGMGGYGGYGAAGGYGGYNIPIGNTIPQQPGMCATQYMCTGQTLLYRNNQCVDQPVQQCPYGCNGNQCAQQNAQYGVGTDGQPCMQPPAQPNSAACTSGAWQKTVASNRCHTGWQCVPGTGAPTATLSCAPQVVDTEMSFTATFKCENANESWGGGFNTAGLLSGTVSVAVGTPPSGATTATYTLACRNAAQQVAGAQCVVQVNRTNIALTAQPTSVVAGAKSTIGWTTSGMKSCVISSPDDQAFTDANSSYKNVNGAAQTPALTDSTTFILTCETYGGQVKTANTQVLVQSQ